MRTVNAIALTGLSILTLWGCTDSQENITPAVGTVTGEMEIRGGIPHFGDNESYHNQLNTLSEMSDQEYRLWAESKGFNSFATAYDEFTDQLAAATSEKELFGLIEEGSLLTFMEDDRLLPRVRHTYEGRLASQEGIYVLGADAYRWINGFLLRGTASDIDALKAATIDPITGQPIMAGNLEIAEQRTHFAMRVDESCGTATTQSFMGTNSSNNRRATITSESLLIFNNAGQRRHEMRVSVYPEYKLLGVWLNHKTTCIYEDGEGELNSYRWENGEMSNYVLVYTHPTHTQYDSKGFTILKHNSPWFWSSQRANGFSYDRYWDKYRAQGRVLGTPGGVLDECGY